MACGDQEVRLTLVISSLQGGGAERVMCELAEQLALRGNQVCLAVLTDSSLDFYDAPSCVERVDLRVQVNSRSKIEALAHLVSKVRALRRLFRQNKPEVIISFLPQTNVASLLAGRSLGLPVIVSERAHPNAENRSKAWRTLISLSYPFADAIVVQTERLRTWFIQHAPAGRYTVIPNAARILPEGPVDAVQEAKELTKRGPFALAVGRLDALKGFDLLIGAYHQADLQSRLIIVGEGPERGRLTREIAKRGLDGKVVLLGARKHVRPFMEHASFFVMSSRSEGFPNVLLEAMSLGVPVISTDCDCGPAEVVEHGKNGLLVPVGDTAAMAKALRTLDNDIELRHKLGNAAREVLVTHAPRRIYDEWHALASKVASTRRAPQRLFKETAARSHQ